MISGFFSFLRSAVPIAAGFFLLVATGALAEEASSAGLSGNSSSLDNSSTVPERNFKIPDRPSTLDDLFGGNRSRPQRIAPPRQTGPRGPRNLLDDSNWGFLTPNDVVRDYMSKTVPTLPDFTRDGRDRNTMSPVERYYERQMRGGGATDSASDGADATSPSFVNPLSGVGIDVGYDALRPSSPHLVDLPTRVDSLPDLLGLRNNPYSPESIRERAAAERQTEAFRKALEVRPPGGITSLPQQNTRSWIASPSSFNPAFVQTAPDPLLSGSYNSAFAVATPAAPAAPMAPSAPGQSRETINPTTTKRIAPPKPDFSLPQRRF
jgi:hypothetical protein